MKDKIATVESKIATWEKKKEAIKANPEEDPDGTRIVQTQKYIDELQAEVRLAVFRKRQQDRDEKEQLEHGPKPILEDNLLRKEQPNT